MVYNPEILADADLGVVIMAHTGKDGTSIEFAPVLDIRYWFWDWVAQFTLFLAVLDPQDRLGAALPTDHPLAPRLEWTFTPERFLPEESLVETGMWFQITSCIRSPHSP